MFVCSLSNLSLFRWLCNCVHSAQDPLAAYQPLPPNTQDEQTWFEKLCWRNLSGSHRNLRLTFKKDCKVEWKIAVWNNQSTLLARTCWHHNDKQQRVSTQSSTAKLQQNGYKWKSTSVIGGISIAKKFMSVDWRDRKRWNFELAWRWRPAAANVSRWRPGEEARGVGGSTTSSLTGGSSLTL